MNNEFCLACGEVHGGYCPPFEVRTTGIEGIRRSYKLALLEIAKLRIENYEGSGKIDLEKLKTENIELKNKIKKYDILIEEIIKYLDRELTKCSDSQLEIDAFKTALRSKL